MLSSLRSTSGNRSRSTLETAFFALLAIAIPLAAASCAQEGATPVCDNNVTKDGILVDPKGTGCEHFGLCSGDPTAMKCCVDADGKLLGGTALRDCLYGFGAQCCTSVKESPDRPDQYVYEGCDTTAMTCCSDLGNDVDACLAGFRVGISAGGSGGTGGSAGGGGAGGTTGP